MGPSVAWGGKAGPDDVGKRFRRLRSTGQWIAGLLVQCKQVSRDRYVHRAVWDDGRPDEWICLQEYRWMHERDYKKMAAKAAGTGRRGRQLNGAGTDSAKPGATGVKRARAKKERAAVRRRRGGTSSEDDESSESHDSFIASSDEVLPRRARRTRIRGNTKREAGKGKGRAGRRNIFPNMNLADGESPLQTQYVRGHTPPLPVYSNKSWIDAEVEKEQQHRAEEEEILSARDLPLRLATLWWPCLQQLLRAPYGMREALQRFFEAGRSLRLPRLIIDNGYKSHVHRQAELDEIVLASGGGSSAGGWNGFGGSVVGAEVAEASQDFGAVELGTGGGECELEGEMGPGGDDGGDGYFTSRPWNAKQQAGDVALEQGGGWIPEDRQEQRLEEAERDDSGNEPDGDFVPVRDVCMDGRTQLLSQQIPGEVEERMQRYVSAVTWGGDKVVRENIWEAFSASAVEETRSEEWMVDFLASRFYTTDDPTALPATLAQKRRARVGTDCYYGPGGRRPELYQSDITHFFQSMPLADAVMPVADSSSSDGVVTGGGRCHAADVRMVREVFLPGRRDVATAFERAYAFQRALAEEEETFARRAREMRGEWPGVPPRGMFERAIAAPPVPKQAMGSGEGLENTWLSDEASQKPHAAEAVEVGLASTRSCVVQSAREEPADAGAAAAEWSRHVRELGSFVLSLGQHFLHVASLLSRQSSEVRYCSFRQCKGGGWGEDRKDKDRRVTGKGAMIAERQKGRGVGVQGSREPCVRGGREMQGRRAADRVVAV